MKYFFLVLSFYILTMTASENSMPGVIFLLSDDAFLNEVVEHHYIKTSGPDKNPLKG